MSLANRFDVELDLDEDETVLDRVFLEVDVWRMIVLALVLIIGTCSMVTMLVLLYVFEQELIYAGGHPPIYSFAQFGFFSAFGLIFFAVAAMIYRTQNGLTVSGEPTDDPATAGQEADD